VGGGSGGGGASSVGGLRFDTGQVYLFGTLSEGAGYRDAIAHWSAPNVAQTGFSSYVDESFNIRPSDKRLVYMDTENATQILAFVEDGDGRGEYPKAPRTNDIPIKTVCKNPTEFYADPSGGELVYLCYGDAPCKTSTCRYYRESGEEYLVPTGHHLLHLGYDKSALLATDNDEWVVRNGKGDLKPVKQAIKSWRIRAHSSGFWAVGPSADSKQPVRWNVALDGTPSLDGTFPLPPPSSRYRFFPMGCALEATGATVCEGDSTDVALEDHLIRAELNKPLADVVYTEAKNPLVKIHISHLVTGP
jgi:hypothetical protein